MRYKLTGVEQAYLTGQAVEAGKLTLQAKQIMTNAIQLVLADHSDIKIAASERASLRYEGDTPVELVVENA